MDRIRGYTLIELVIVLALFSILITISVPNFGLLRAYKETQELKEFKRDILFARNQAIVVGEPHKILIDYDLNYYSIVKNGETIKSHYFSSGVKVVKKIFHIEESSINDIDFNRTGRPSNAGTIFLKNSKSEYYRITISPASGNVNLYRGEK